MGKITGYGARNTGFIINDVLRPAVVNAIRQNFGKFKIINISKELYKHYIEPNIKNDDQLVFFNGTKLKPLELEHETNKTHSLLQTLALNSNIKIEEPQCAKCKMEYLNKYNEFESKKTPLFNCEKCEGKREVIHTEYEVIPEYVEMEEEDLY